MSSQATQYAAREHTEYDDAPSSDGGVRTEKARVDTDAHHLATTEMVHEPLPQQRRFWLRALIAIFVPIFITVFYCVIWFYVVGVEATSHDAAVNYRTYGGSQYFYPWFVISVFALSWAKYGLVGIEAAMLFRSRFWAPPNDTVALLRHSNSTWNSPKGWYSAIRYGQAHRLWLLLSLISILSFIAIPLSGLAFELSDGYVSVSDVPLVQGRNFTTYNNRYDTGQNSRVVEEAWSVGLVPTIPGFGIIYTNQSTDRSKHPDLGKVPNSLPLTESIPDLFLVPQAERPVSGKSWGLRVRYDCSIVRSASDFTILSERSNSSIESVCRDLPFHEQRNCLTLRTPSGNSIRLMNTTVVGLDTTNIEAYYEVGSAGPDRFDGMYNTTFPDFEGEEGNTTIMVLEYAAWQYRTSRLGASYDDRSLPFKSTIDATFEGMGSPFIKSSNDSFAVNRTFFELNGDLDNGVQTEGRSTNASILVGEFELEDHFRKVIGVAQPIGARCIISSTPGTADLDGVTSSFRNFNTSVPPPTQDAHSFRAARFGFSGRQSISDTPFQQHFTSGGLPGLQPLSNTNRWPQYVDGPALLRSMNLAFALDAYDLLFGIKSIVRDPFPEPGLTSSRESRILTVSSLIPGPANATGHAVLALLCTWAALSAGFGLWYGFRLRVVDTYDGNVMLRKGALEAEELREDREFMAGKPLDESRALAKELEG